MATPNKFITRSNKNFHSYVSITEKPTEKMIGLATSMGFITEDKAKQLTKDQLSALIDARFKALRKKK